MTLEICLGARYVVKNSLMVELIVKPTLYRLPLHVVIPFNFQLVFEYYPVLFVKAVIL